jgi:sterol desaturase/sphingolipid hydroxylase (fatty acid hydroxylase superfamily)
MDASTALRFHFGELTISTLFRAAQILVIGVSPLAFSVWQTFMLSEILFHHSNVRLPEYVEKYLVWLIVTPKMHDIHHRAVLDKTDSNWSSGFSFWDRLHNSWHQDFDSTAGPIGVATFQAQTEVTLRQVLALPFKHQKSAWQLPLEPIARC